MRPACPVGDRKKDKSAAEEEEKQTTVSEGQ
jgi:hypothetical protein